MKKKLEKDQLTGHFQSFFSFSSPPDPKSEKGIPINQLVKNSGLIHAYAKCEASGETVKIIF